MPSHTGIVRAAWGLFGSWYCAPLDTSDEDVAAAVIAKEGDPNYDMTLTPSRLFGGYRCADDPNRRHVYHAGGLYTYTGTNYPLSRIERAGHWHAHLADHREGPGRFIGGGPCCADAPTPITVEE